MCLPEKWKERKRRKERKMRNKVGEATLSIGGGARMLQVKKLERERESRLMRSAHFLRLLICLL